MTGNLTSRINPDATYDALRIGDGRYIVSTGYVGDLFRAARAAGVPLEPFECVFGLSGSKLLAHADKIAAVDPEPLELAALVVKE